jgi:hypothetical protein
MSVRVESLDAALVEASKTVTAQGGFTASEDVDLSASLHAQVTYRVPAAKFRATLDALAKVGKVQSQSVDSNDVTAQYADLEGRVKTLRASIARLQGFLLAATDITQVASLESELTSRESELESIESQRRALADQVDLSTVTVSFDATSASPSPSTVDDRPGFSGGLEAGVDVLKDLGSAALAVFGFLLPFLPFVAVLLLIVVLARRRARRRRAVTMSPSSPDGASPPPQPLSPDLSGPPSLPDGK